MIGILGLVTEPHIREAATQKNEHTYLLAKRSWCIHIDPKADKTTCKKECVVVDGMVTNCASHLKGAERAKKRFESFLNLE